MKGVMLISDGIDSPVAADMMLARGLELHFLHMDNQPFTDDAPLNKVISLCNHLFENHGRQFTLSTVPYGKAIQMQIARMENRHYQCVICRRMMYRIAEALAEDIGADVIVTGESLGQVASQTLRNLFVEEKVVTIPILRPLIGMDKSEIMAYGRERGTYDISIEPGLCCTLAPDKPKTYADPAKVEALELSFDVKAIISEAITGRKDFGIPRN
jgi:thiamine biosynthesis protein ThiI